MRRLIWFACVMLSISWQTSLAQSPLRVREGLRMPTVLLKPTPPEWIALYEQAQTDLHGLVSYIDPSELSNPNSKIFPPGAYRFTVMQYAVDLLGDFGGVEIIPVLQNFAQIYRQCPYGSVADKQLAFVLDLTAERIRYRAMGREEYIREMIRWVRTPPPDPPGGEASIERMDRIIVGARALGVIKAREAVPVLQELLEKEWRTSPWSLFILRPLAQIGDRRAMADFEYEMRNCFFPWSPAEQVPLQPGERDIGVVYWQMRTQGMTQNQVIDELIRSMADSFCLLREDAVLRDLVGPVAVPQLLKTLSEPPEGKAQHIAQGKAALLLGEWRVSQAVPELRKLLRGTAHLFVRMCAARALGHIADLSALDDLITVARDRNEHSHIRSNATEALGGYRRSEATDTLVDLLDDKQVRAVALDALAKCGTPAIIPVLEQRYCVETNDSFKRTIAWTIKRIKERARLVR